MILLVASNKDPASLNISSQILNKYPFHKTQETFQENPTYTAAINGKIVTLITLNHEAVNAQHLPENFPDATLIVFVTRHSSQSGTPTLSVHTPGNLGPAELGGLPKTVSTAPATAMRNALKALEYFKQGMQLKYEVSYECTHHGPSLNTPTMFVELGSSPEQWSDTRAAEAVAHAAILAIAKSDISENTAVLGIGGTHYNKHFTRMALEDAEVFGHMIPKYALQLADTDMLKQCIAKTVEKVDSAILDWKGIKSENKIALLAALQETGLPYRKI
jgi:D-aminoacyl-tRNA deacylase